MSVDKRSLTAAPRKNRDAPPTPIAPLYKRLPHGPHRLGREEVVRHQRIRMHGAMVEAAAAHGYEGTSVRQVIALAGVSRRSFYEQFANKEECLMATFDLLTGTAVRRAGDAYLASEGPLEERLRAALAQFAEAITRNRKGALLVFAETPTAGIAGLMRLRRVAATCERMLCRSFTELPDANPLPAPIVRGITGGLHGAMSMCMREGPAMRSGELTEQMLEWTLRFQTPAGAEMGALIAERVKRRMAAGHAQGRGPRVTIPRDSDERARLMDSILRLAAVEDLRELSALRIADHANVSVDAFFELFEGRDECFLAALDGLAGELIRVTTVEGLASADWHGAVCRGIAELMVYLAERPHYARTIAVEAYVGGRAAAQRNLELARALAGVLTEGAPGEPPGRLTLEGVGGAIWHTVRCQVASDRIELLPALADYLSYVVLAPFIGAEAAVEVVSGSRPPSRRPSARACGGDRSGRKDA
jgi:AcrR family transcriptional regulator